MGKQILIDYEEYLRLEKCQNVLKDIIEELEYKCEYYDDPMEYTQTLRLKMPDSFKEIFKGELENKRLSGVIFKF